MMKINLKSSTTIKPMAETPGGTVWLSNLDLLMPAACHTHALYLYRSNGAVNFFDPTVLKAALSRALVEFYPYAGRLKRSEHNNRLEINCTTDGVVFVEADCDATLDDLGDFSPKPDLRLIPAVDYSQGISTFPLLLLQLTRFKCGGVSLGVANEHHLSDGFSALHWTNSWADIARGHTIGLRPLFDRTLLAARNPPCPHFPHVEYQPPPALITTDHNTTTEMTSFSIFKLTRVQVDALKAKCSTDGNYSTFEVVTGHVWRCVCMARGLPADQESKLHIPVDGRSRLRPPLPLGFFGNVIFSATPIASCGELARLAVGKVHDAIARLDDDYKRSALDYLELRGDVTAMAHGDHITKCPNLMIISWVRLPLYEADFGWGKPVYTGPGAAPSTDGKSYLLANPENDGSLLYAVTLLKQQMNLFEKLLYNDTTS